jgi:hypothetical protein
MGRIQGFYSPDGQNRLSSKITTGLISSGLITSQSGTGNPDTRSKQFFRYSRGVAKGRWSRTWKTVELSGFLEVGSDAMMLRIPSRLQKDLRALLMILPSFVISFFTSLTLWNRIELYLLDQIDKFCCPTALAPKIVGIIGIILIGVFAFTGWIATLFFEFLGIVYLLDLLSFPLQTHYSVQYAIVRPREVQMGRLRHVLRLVVDKRFVEDKDSGTETVVSVIASRRRLSQALAQLQGAGSTV